MASNSFHVRPIGPLSKEQFLMKTLFLRHARLIVLTALFAFTLAACGSTSNTNGPVPVRLGYFPNVTHATALVGVARGTFQAALGPNVALETRTFNAGP